MKNQNIFENAVFVLGAGASRPYGFPTGAELKDEILGLQHKLDSNEARYVWLFQNLKNSGFTVADVKNFCENFQGTGSPSIDDFLQSYYEEKHEHYTLGNLLISYFICQKEHAFSLSNNDWIEVLTQYLMQKEFRDSFLKKQPTFISFNYDNHFKHKIEYNLRNQFLIKNFMLNPVIHIHGKTNGKNFVRSQKAVIDDENFDVIIESSKSMSLIRTGKLKESNLVAEVGIMQQAKQTNIVQSEINKAEKIIILGYGFNKTNNTILFNNNKNFEKLIAEGKIFASGYKLDTRLFKKINDIAATDSTYRPIQNVKCLDLLEDLIPRDLF